MKPRRPLAALLVGLASILAIVPAGLIVAYRFVPPAATPLMVIRLAEGEGWRRDWVPLSQIAAHLPRAVIAAEDNLFCVHEGFDWKAVREAWGDVRSGRRLRGASTISMQTAKNLFLWPGRDWVRKGLEAGLTVQVELVLPKRRIMELYLNVVEFGPGIYGAEAAARHHFGKAAADLTAREASLLAAVLPDPRTRSAGSPSQFVASRAARIRTITGQLGPLLDCVEPER